MLNKKNVKGFARTSKMGGFTLIELLVVIAIIGMLATTVMVSLGAARAKGRDAKRIADLANIRTALEIFYDSTGGLPEAIYEGEGNTTPTDLQPYITKVPLDPDGTTYKYTSYKRSSTAKATAYLLGAVLEQENPVATDDINKCSNSVVSPYIQVGTGATWCGASTDCGATASTPDHCYQISNTSL